MTLRLIHMSDWQIGKVFRSVDSAMMELLQEARLRAITTGRTGFGISFGARV